MKLLLVHNRYLYAGGEDEVFAAEGALLRRQGHTVEEYVEDNRSIQRLGKAVVAARTLWSQPAVRHLQKKLCQHHPAVVHFHNTFPLISPAVYYACRSTGTPVVQTLHNYRLLCAGSTFFRDGQVCELCLGRRLGWPGMVHRCYHQSIAQSAVVTAMLGLHRLLRTWDRQVDLFIALCEFARKKFIQGGLPRERIMVIPNFVEPDPGAEFTQGGYVLYAGRLSPEKGVSGLLQAWRRLPQVPLYIAGDGPLLGRVHKLATSDSALSNVKVLGRRNRAELLQLMKAARFLVVPSQWYESFPMVIVQAFACGLPVVASNLGATAEIVEHGRTGLLARPGEPEDLADKVGWLWIHRVASRQMGREARMEFESKYSPPRHYKRLLEAYENVLKQGSSRRRP